MRNDKMYKEEVCMNGIFLTTYLARVTKGMVVVQFKFWWNEDDLKNEDNIRNEDNLKNEDNLTNKSYLTKACDLKIEDALK